MDEFELELKNDFLDESSDLLDSAEEAFLRLESERDNIDLLNEIFRLAHNLKGTSMAVGFDQLSEVTHIAENLILKLKEGKLIATDEVISTLLEFKDEIKKMVDTLTEDINAKFDSSELVEKINKIIENGLSEQMVQSNESEQEVEVNGPLLDQSLEIEHDSIKAEDFECFAEEENNEEFSEATPPESLEFHQKPEPNPEKSDQQEKQSSSNNRKPPHGGKDESIRVNLSRIDKINNVVGELIILQTVVSQRRYEYINDDLVNKSIGIMNKLFKEVQEVAMSLRMLPLKTTFQKMNRIVRDTSKALSKDVELQLIGEETEVDKNVLEKLADPLVHIIRNAVDHGLEDTEDRLEKGKSPVGVVELMAFHEGSNLVIQVTDDGKGIDPEIIKEKAKKKGVYNSAQHRSHQELIQLIFHPGFSTKENVTEVSGRGVGMDVVKTNIESLGGEVQLRSKLGKGSSVKITLPLTLAIIEGLIMRSNKEKFIIPLSQIFEISHIKDINIKHFTGIASLFKLRGEVLPLFYLNEKLGEQVQKNDHHTVVIVRGMNYAFGLVVDDILNQQQVVIKKLGEDVKNQKGFMGSAIMADGTPSLILDLYELFKDDLKQSRGYKNLVENLNETKNKKTA